MTCGMPLILLMAMDGWLREHPEVTKSFEGKQPSLQEIVDAIVKTEGKS